MRYLPWKWIHRGGLGYFVMGLIVLSGAVWSFGALVEIGNTATTEQSLTTLPVPYAGYLFAGSVDLFIFYGYLKCYGPVWQIALSVFHILIGLATSLWFQWQHSKGIVDPVQVSVVPALAVAVSLDTWVVSQLVDWFGSRKSQPALARPAELPTSQAAQPTQDVPGLRSNRQQAAAPAPSRPNGLTAAQTRRVEGWVGEGRTNVSQMQRDLGVSDRARKDHLAPLVRELLAARNGDRPKVDA